MKVLALFATLLAFPVFAGAQSMKGMDMHHKDMPMKHVSAETAATVHEAKGNVTKVDRAKGSVTIAHGPVASLKWPAMTMPFGVNDKALLDKVQAGANVEFRFVQSGRNYTITEIK